MEFKEVAKQYGRMCANNPSCINCPLHHNELDIKTQCLSLWYTKTDWFESIVSKWAKEHPEPRYPTWSEWLQTTFPDRDRHVVEPCPRAFDKAYPCDKHCEVCYQRSIPEHLAVKLGIQKVVPAIDRDKIMDKTLIELATMTFPNIDKISTEEANDSCNCLR